MFISPLLLFLGSTQLYFVHMWLQKGKLADSHCKPLALCHATVIKLFWDHGFSKDDRTHHSLCWLASHCYHFCELTQFFKGLLEHVEMLLFDNPWVTVGQIRHIWFLPINKHLQYSSLILQANFQPLSVSQVSHRGCRTKCSSWMLPVNTWVLCPSAHLHRIFKRQAKKKTIQLKEGAKKL